MEDPITTRRTIRLEIAYDGTEFMGWQRQPDQRTVQGVVETAVASITGTAAAVHGSGRTDAGVHALGQVAHFQSESRLSTGDLARALNARLPRDVVVRGVADVRPDFHARYSARRKTYIYQVYVAAHRDPFLDRYALQVRSAPDVTAMREAAARLEGRHDFRPFATGAAAIEDTVRDLTRVRVVRGSRGFRIYATANGFLRHMVRALAGLLLCVGDGRSAPTAVDALLESRCRSGEPAAAPPHALVLWRVDY